MKRRTRRPHVLMETFFAGNCLFDRRPLYFGVRTRDHHYLWKEYRDPHDTLSPEGHELYDVGADPGELDNIYRPDHPLGPGFNAVIAQRLAELPEITDERIIGLFGPKVAADVQRAVAKRGNWPPVSEPPCPNSPSPTSR